MSNYEISKEYIFKKYYKQFCHYAWKLTGDTAVSEDIVQDSFIAYFDKGLSVYEDEVAIKNFIYTAIRFASLKKLRKEKSQERYWMYTKFEEADEQTIEREIIRTEVITQIATIMEEMPEACRQVFRLGYLEGFSNMEISDLENISINTVKTQKQRALKILKMRLNPEFFLLFITVIE